MEQTYNPNTQEAEAGDCHNLETNMGYTARLFQKQNTHADMVAACVMSALFVVAETEALQIREQSSSATQLDPDSKYFSITYKRIKEKKL